jgi:hypothetical protein
MGIAANLLLLWESTVPMQQPARSSSHVGALPALALPPFGQALAVPPLYVCMMKPWPANSATSAKVSQHISVCVELHVAYLTD